MRYIVKTRRCVAFDQYVASRNPTNWSKFNRKVKLTLHQHLLEEQQHLCIYCQQSIPKKEKVQKGNLPSVVHPSHIEHIRPKDGALFPHLAFDYSNLSVSCDGFDLDTAIRRSPDFCGHKKSNDFDDNRFLHPFEAPDIEDFFDYDINGGISPTAKGSGKATYTIDLLQLNDPVLKDLREKHYQLIIEETTHNGLDINTYLDPTQPELPKFFSMLRQLFGLVPRPANGL